MKKIYLPLVLACLTLNASAQKAFKKIPVQNTIEILPGDNLEQIRWKSAHIIPTANQVQALRNEYTAFIHFGPNTFTRQEWGNGYEDPKVFDLKELDTDQWCEAIKAAGMKLVILTVKHHDGFVLWQSRYTVHGIMSSNFENGKGDILKELSKSAAKYGLKLGVYLSPADLFQIENSNGLYGNLSKYTKRTIPRAVEGRPFKNPTKFEFEVDDYNEYFLNQLFEILTEYGPIHEVWFDGAHPKRKGGQTYNYPAWKKLIHTLAPEAVIFGREDLRWCGNESGGTRKTEWNAIGYAEDPHQTSTFPDMTDDDLGSPKALSKSKYIHYQPAETNTSIREGWFYRDDTRQKVRSADDVFDIYERAVGGNSIFLLNIPPNRDGKFSPTDVNSLVEAGKRIRETYDIDLLKGAKGPKALLDHNDETAALLKKEPKEIIVSTSQPIEINRIVLQEAISKYGERVESHAVDAWINGEWTQIAEATNIGYKRILRFATVKTDRLRVRVRSARAIPAISTLSAHYYKARPPQVESTLDADDKLILSAAKTDFGWKAHGEDIAKNLNADLKIYYSLDGSEPNSLSSEYRIPLDVEGQTIKAVAISNGEAGPVYETIIGYSKKNWSFIKDSNSKLENQSQAITIDMKDAKNLKGFAYTPEQNNPTIMLFKGTISISQDGKMWKQVESFELGNLVNDPSKRYHFFDTTYSTRFVRIQSLSTDSINTHQIDLF